MRILHIDTSIKFEGSISRQVSAEIVAALSSEFPEADVVRRDLARQPLSHISHEAFLALGAAPATIAPERQADFTANRAALDEFIAADVVVIGAPMYNLTVPSTLKAWLDRICVAGVTFQYTPTGPIGLKGDKPILIASARGGIYTGHSPFYMWDHQESYLRSVFRIIGVGSVHFIHAEGLDLGAGMRDPAVVTAIEKARAFHRRHVRRRLRPA